LAGYLANVSLNEAASDKNRKYRADYNNNPPNSISFIPAISSTSGRLHSDFVCLLSGQFHYLLTVFSSQLRSKIVSILTKDAALRITLNIDGAPT
jgi:hypothetical protein